MLNVNNKKQLNIGEQLVRIYLSTFKSEEKTLPMSFVIDVKGIQTKWHFGANSSHLVKACEIGQ